ncbi:hypothetical protein [Mucilaginibacter sp. dw_454]|uniref:hypothetical protein n=1 Tax=Mucilaginibacter sp. dw_454 TaxID=2720079 RepID=UPI001BD69959|nr:hypothetical protein [Mucilaginibacter sp. dw_454]
MKKTFFLSVLTIGINLSCFAQQFETIKKPDLKPKKMLILIKTNVNDHNQIPFPQAMQAFADSDIAEMQVFKGEEAVKLFGERGEKGVVILTIMNTPNLLSTTQLLNKYAISKQNQTLPIEINGELLLYPNIFLSSSQIKSVSIIPDKRGKPQHVSILTKKTETGQEKDWLFKKFGWSEYTLTK